MADGLQIKPAEGKLGVLTPGMGAVSSTFFAGVEAVSRSCVRSHGYGGMMDPGDIDVGSFIWR